MNGIKKRAAYYMLFIAVLIVVASITYDLAMRAFEPGPYPPEDVDISLVYSLQFVVETFTATGYGSHSPWFSSELTLFVVLLDLTGVALFFLALPAVLIPLFQDALSRSPPTEVDDGLSDHVIICGYTTRAEALIDELASSGVDYLQVEPEYDTALELAGDGYSVAHADPESVSDLRRTNIGEARALVADVSDRVDASIVLAAKEAAEGTHVISVVEDPNHESYHRLAGADDVLTPRTLLGSGLARKVTTGLSSELGDTVELGEAFDVIELPVQQGSTLAGETLGESTIRERFGVNVIGAWHRGDFETPPSPDRQLGRGTVLLVAGSQEQLDRLATAVRTPSRQFRRGNTVVIGHGEVGRTVTDALAEAGVAYTVVDAEDRPAVDVVGDAMEDQTLREAGVPDADSVVLAIPDDTTTEFTVLVVRDLNESAEVIVRADDVGSIDKMYRAGADYVLSLAAVSGRSIASKIVETEEVLSVGSTVNLLRTAAPGLVGDTLAGARVRERTGVTVVAVERNGTLRTDLEAGFQFQDGDRVVIAGTAEGTSRFVETYG